MFMKKEDIFIEIIKKTVPDSEDFIGDDTAYIPKKDLLLTQDTLIEDVHFRKSTTSPYYLGRKSIAVNLSDIAASGGVPAYVLISLSMPENIDDRFVEEFYQGVNDICNEHDVFLVGGDLTKSFRITISVCAIGVGNGLNPASRKNANIGDCVIVTGNFGSSRTGLEILEKGETFEKKLSAKKKKKFVNAHINPVPRIKEGRIILRTARKPALIDASDGLADSLYKICLCSNTGMVIDFNAVPYDKDIALTVKDEQALFNRIFYGGEDYELVGTVSEKIYKKLRELKIPVKKIGSVVPVEKAPCVYVETKAETVKIDSETIQSELFGHFL